MCYKSSQGYLSRVYGLLITRVTLKNKRGNVDDSI